MGIFELGGLPERELEKLKQEAERLGKGSFAFAFYMDRQKEERERGVTIACTTKEFYTDKWHYTIIDAPGHRDFIKNMITGASQADVALIMVPADGNFTTAIAKGNHKAGEIQGQTRQHSRLINLLGVKQIAIGVNKMDCDTAAYKQSRYDEIANEMKNMLVKVGWKKDFIEKNTPVLPISGWMGDNLLKKSENMGWWKGMAVEYGKENIHVTLCTMCSTSFAVFQSAQPVPRCECPSPESTRSREWVVSLLVARSREWSSLVKKLSSCPRTPPQTPAQGKFSLWRCITRALTSPTLVTTSA